MIQKVCWSSCRLIRNVSETDVNIPRKETEYARRNNIVSYIISHLFQQNISTLLVLYVSDVLPAVLSPPSPLSENPARGWAVIRGIEQDRRRPWASRGDVSP